jgi:hypothetical protein
MSTQKHQADREAVIASFPEPDTQSRQYTGDQRCHDDANDMKLEHGIPSVDWDACWSRSEAARKEFAEAGERKWKKKLLPNIIRHAYDPDESWKAAGGTDLLSVGEPGSGKSNFALWLSQRLMESNDEKVVWRASTSRSEWLPFAPWARVCLPKGVDVRAEFVPKIPTQDGFEVKLEEIVREVVRYNDVVDLNKRILKPGMFHVIYPDPRMRGCQWVYEQDQEKQYEGLEFSGNDPINHWWFGWMHARVSQGPHHFSSILFDEIGDIAPESASKDEFAHYQKVELLKDCWVDARKYGHSIFAFGHSEADIHSMIRRKIRWRATMAGTTNPTSAGGIVGFGKVPMNHDIMSARDVGDILVYNEGEFQYPPLNTTHIESPTSMTLKVTYEGEV